MHGVIGSIQICTENENKIHVKMFRKGVIKGVTKGEIKGKETGDAMKVQITFTSGMENFCILYQVYNKNIYTVQNYSNYYVFLCMCKIVNGKYKLLCNAINDLYITTADQ